MTSDKQAQELIENIEAGVRNGTLDLSDETLTGRDGHTFDINRIHPEGVQNVSPSELFDFTDDEVAATLQGNEGALLRPSTNKPYNIAPRSNDETAQVRFAAQAQAAIMNPQARQMLDPNASSNFKNLLDAMRDLPVPDATVWVDNRRVVVPGEVITVPNNVPKKGSLKLLEQLLGGDCKGDKRNVDGTLERCDCPTHQVCRVAQSFGLRDKPVLWLSQHLFTETRKKEVRKLIPLGDDFKPENDGDDNAPAPKAIATLFSYSNAEPLMLLSEARNRNILDVFRIITGHIVKVNMELTRPKEYDDRFAM